MVENDMTPLTLFLIFLGLAAVVTIFGLILGFHADEDSQEWADDRYENSWDDNEH